MRCPRHIALVMLAAFAVKAGVPAPILVTHQHEGGGHAHVHAETLAPHHDHHDDEAEDHHQWDRASDVPGVGLVDESTEHTHWQLPFQRIAPATDVPAFALHALQRVVPVCPSDPAVTPALVARSRGPPPSSAAA